MRSNRVENNFPLIMLPCYLSLGRHTQKIEIKFQSQVFLYS